MADDKPVIPRPKRRKKLRKVVVRERAEYKGYFRLKTPSGKKDENGKPFAVYVLSWKDEHGNRKQQREHIKDDEKADDEARSRLESERTRVKEILTKGRPETPAANTFERFAKEYLKYQKNRIAPYSSKGHITQAEFDRQEGIINKHLVPFFGPDRISAIQREQVLKYVNMRMGEPVRGGGTTSDGTLLKERNVLRAVFYLAEEQGKIFSNPAAGRGMSKHLPEQPEGRVRWLEKDEWKRVFDACYIEPTKGDPEPKQWLQQAAALALALGARRGELMHTTVPDVDLERGGVNLRRTKSGKARWVPINQLARMVFDAMSLAERKKRGDRKVLWPEVESPAHLSMKFIRACRKAKVEDFSFHDLRHCNASWLRMSGADLHDIQTLLGHSDPRMTSRYAHLSPEHLAAASARLDGVFTLPSNEASTLGEVKALPADTTS